MQANGEVVLVGHVPNEPFNRERLITSLQALLMLHGLSRASLEQLAQIALPRSYAPGALLFLEGDQAPPLFYLDAGWVKVVKMAPDGREQILTIVGAGELFGSIVGLASQRSAPATAIALDTTDAWAIPQQAFRHLLIEQPILALQIIDYMAERLESLVTLVADLSLHTVTSRLARMLLEQAEGGVIQRQRWATQTEIAARLGTVPDVLSRALRGLVEARLIELSRHQIRILDQAGLARKTTL